MDPGRLEPAPRTTNHPTSAPRPPASPPDPPQLRSRGCDADADEIPEGWAPFQDDPVVWDDSHAAFLDVCLHLHRTLENFNPNDRTHHLVGRDGKPLPRVEWINLRENAGLTQQQLAEQLGTGQPSIARWETGIRRPDRNAAYITWLIDQATEQAADVRMQIFMLAALRDGWAETDANPYPHLWEAIFKQGGTYDRWLETGSLPTWTPKDAGVAA